MTSKEWQQRYDNYRNETHPGYFWKPFYDYKHHCMGGHWYLSENTPSGKQNFLNIMDNEAYDMNERPTLINVKGAQLRNFLTRCLCRFLEFIVIMIFKMAWKLFIWTLKGCYRVVKYIFNYANQESKEDKSNTKMISKSIEYCPYCGKQISINTRFCPFCGRKIR